jgi:thioredoxin reductase
VGRIENYLGFSDIETADLIAKFDEHVEKYGIEKVVGTEVGSLDLTEKIKKVSIINGNTYRTFIIGGNLVVENKLADLDAPGIFTLLSGE